MPVSEPSTYSKATIFKTVVLVLLAGFVLVLLAVSDRVAQYLEILMAIAVAGQIFAWGLTALVMGIPTWKTIVAYRDISRNMQYQLWDFKWIACVSVGCALLAYSFSAPVLYRLGIAAPLMHGWVALRLYQPAAILVLGRSNDDAFWLQSELDLPFLRTVSLLDVAQYNYDLNQPDRKVMSFNILRTHDNDEWMGVVETLLRECPVIVMDVSNTSDPVQYELERLVEKQLAYKTVCVSSHAPASAALERAGATGLDISRFALVPKVRVRNLLRYVLSRRSRLPHPENPIAEIDQRLGSRDGKGA